MSPGKQGPGRAEHPGGDVAAWRGKWQQKQQRGKHHGARDWQTVQQLLFGVWQPPLRGAGRGQGWVRASTEAQTAIITANGAGF